MASNCPVLQQLAVMLPETDTDVAMKADFVKDKLGDLSHGKKKPGILSIRLVVEWGSLSWFVIHA